MSLRVPASAGNLFQICHERGRPSVVLSGACGRYFGGERACHPCASGDSVVKVIESKETRHLSEGKDLKKNKSAKTKTKDFLLLFFLSFLRQYEKVP